MSTANVLELPVQASIANFEHGSIFFVGTATVILRYAGFTILTDPNFLHQGDHVHLGYGLRSARRTNPAIDIEDLPPDIDLVVLSHMHEDHFDRLVEEKLDKTLPIVSTHHATQSLQRKGFLATHALNPWETLTVKKGNTSLRITSMPGRHGPGILAAALPPVMGSMLEFQPSHELPNGETRFRLYITGDTLVYDQLLEIPKRYPDIDLGLFHLGGTKIFGVLLTMDAKQGVQAVQIIDPRLAIPIHYNDYTVCKSSLEEFMQAVKEAGLESRVRYLTHGDIFNFEVPVRLSQQT